GIFATVLGERLILFAALTTRGIAIGWGLAAIGTGLGTVLVSRFGSSPRPLKLPRPSALALCLSLPILAVALLTGLTALAAWPNEWDSMAYHLGRVLHWTQNQSVAHYPTNIGRQLLNPPWSGFAILQLTLLGGEER